MSEQDKKRWVMYKKAVQIEEFNFGTYGSIIPKFAEKALQATNEYGVWRLSGTSGCLPWFAVDGNTSTRSVLTAVNSYDIYIDVPEGTSICPSLFSLHQASTTFYVEIRGYNPETSAWEYLGKPVGTTSLPVNVSSYYTRFRITVSDTSTYSASYIYEFRLCAGKIKKG